MTQIPKRFSNGVDLGYLESPEASILLHKRSDLNNGVDAQHHSLGSQPYQAAPGNHGSASLKYVKPDLQNGYVGYETIDALWEFIGYTKNHAGWVSCGGLIRAGASSASGTLLWTFPEGYRPRTSLHIPCASSSAVGIINVYEDGSVKCNVGLSTAWISTDAICFQAVN